jgi:hypothetical protein
MNLDRFSTSHIPLFVSMAICLGGVTLSASGQDAQSHRKEQKKELDALRQQVLELQTQVKPLLRALEEQDMIPAVAKPSANPSTSSMGEQPQRRAAISQANKYDLESPTSSAVTYFGPASGAMIPGTKTEVRVHGLIELQMIHDSVGLNNNRFDTAGIPIDGGPSQTKFSVNPTQFAVSTLTPVEQGYLNTWFSMDMNGQLDRPEPRLRLAFGEYVNDDLGLGVLVGQAYSTMFDLRSAPETLDFATPTGIWQQRQPLLRVTKSIKEDVTAEVSFETPESVSYTGADKLTRWPDLVVAATWFADGDYIKHIKLAALARDLRAAGTNGAADSALGWAVSGSGKMGLPFLGPKDNLKLTLHYGDGYGTQLKGGPQEGVFDDVSSELETIGVFGAYGGIQHFWSGRWRSNFVYGEINADNPDIVSGDTLDSTSYAAVDLICNPWKTVTLGVEYLWGRRENQDGSSGTANRVLLSSKMIF